MDIKMMLRWLFMVIVISFIILGVVIFQLANAEINKTNFLTTNTKPNIFIPCFEFNSLRDLPRMTVNALFSLCAKVEREIRKGIIDYNKFCPYVVFEERFVPIPCS